MAVKLKPGAEKTNKVAWVDPDDAPELTSEHFAQADWYQGDVLVRRGRPPAGSPKQLVSLRIDQDVVERLRASGPGWQTRAAEALRAFADKAEAFNQAEQNPMSERVTRR